MKLPKNTNCGETLPCCCDFHKQRIAELEAQLAQALVRAVQYEHDNQIKDEAVRNMLRGVIGTARAALAEQGGKEE